MAKFNVSLGIGIANARQTGVIEIPDEDIDSCESNEAKEDLLQWYLNEWISNYIDAGIWEAE